MEGYAGSSQALEGRSARRYWVPSKLIHVSISVFTALLAVGFLFPFVWAVSSSLKTAMEVISFPPRLFPSVPQWGNYTQAWSPKYAQGTEYEAAWGGIRFGRFFWNSSIVSILVVLGEVASSLLVAYGFARFRFPGRDALFAICLSGLMMPVYVTIIPLSVIFQKIGWIDTLKPLIVPSYFGSAFAIFLFRQFLMSIPFDFDESALIDGGNRLTILTQILLPNCKPVIAAVAIFAFRSSWNRFLGPLVFIDSVENYTLPLGLWFLRTYADMPGLPQDHVLMAATVITTVPVLIVFLSAQGYFIEGIVMTGLKG